MVALEAETSGKFAKSSISAWLQYKFQCRNSLSYRVKPCLNKMKENKSAFINLQQAHLAKSECSTTWQYLKEQNSVYPAIISAEQPFPEKGKWRTNVDWLLMGEKKRGNRPLLGKVFCRCNLITYHQIRASRLSKWALNPISVHLRDRRHRKNEGQVTW